MYLCICDSCGPDCILLSSASCPKSRCITHNPLSLSRDRFKLSKWKFSNGHRVDQKRFFVTEQNKERLLDIAELLEWKNFQVDLEEECPSLSCQHNGHCVDDDELLLMMTILMLVMMMMMRRRRRRRNANVDHVFTMGRKLAADWPAAAASRPRWEGFGGSMGSVGVGLGQGVVLISLLNSLSNKVPPYIPSGID